VSPFGPLVHSSPGQLLGLLNGGLRDQVLRFVHFRVLVTKKVIVLRTTNKLVPINKDALKNSYLVRREYFHALSLFEEAVIGEGVASVVSDHFCVCLVHG
jgi:hypothetical protein